MIAATFVQARAHDGRKRTEVPSTLNDVKDVADWIEGQIRAYRGFTQWTRQYPDHRKRLAYVVKVYEKENING